MFNDRTEAGHQLAQRIGSRSLQEPLVLAIPRGGVVIGAALARDLGAELDVVLSRKLRAPAQPELAIGAIGEDGELYLADFAASVPGATDQYVEREREHQLAEIRRRTRLFRAAKPMAEVARRSVILTDDGIATGATMLAALRVLQKKDPREIILAVPVASPDTLERFRPLCSEIVCLLAPWQFRAIGEFYRDFEQVEDAEVVRLLRESGAAQAPPGGR